MSGNDETAGRHADEDLTEVKAYGTVGVGTDGSLVNHTNDRADDDRR